MISANNSRFTITLSDYNNVVKDFSTHHYNATSDIANRLNLSYNYVNFILDRYLEKKRNYMG